MPLPVNYPLLAVVLQSNDEDCALWRFDGHLAPLLSDEKREKLQQLVLDVIREECDAYKAANQ